MKQLIILFILGCTLGCAGPSGARSFASINSGAKTTPRTQIFVDPTIVFTEYKTFDVQPFNVLTKSDVISPVFEKQLSFMMQNFMEARGYRKVAAGEQPDLVVTAAVSRSEKLVQDPPQVVQLPIYAQGTSVTYSNTRRRYAENTAMLGYTSTVVEGRTRQLQVLNTLVQIFDAKTQAMVWDGRSRITQDDFDDTLMAQYLMFELAKQVPFAQNQRPFAPRGLRFSILTGRGQNYWPIITEIEPMSPSRQAMLNVNSVMLSINGVSTHNMAYSDVAALLAQDLARVQVQTRGGSRIVDFTQQGYAGEFVDVSGSATK